MPRSSLAALALAVVALAPAARADHGDRPPPEHLVLAGLAMAPPSYAIALISHEGSHALAGKLFGAEVTEFRLMPGRYGRDRSFHFGYTRVSGYLSPGEKTIFWLAPKMADALLVGGYSAALALDALPENHYAQLAFAALATGFWVDFSKDIIAFWDSNDVVKAYSMNGLDSEWERLPFRLLHAGLSAAGAYALFEGYRRVFDEGPPASGRAVVVPILSASF